MFFFHFYLSVSSACAHHSTPKGSGVPWLPNRPAISVQGIPDLTPITPSVRQIQKSPDNFDLLEKQISLNTRIMAELDQLKQSQALMQQVLGRTMKEKEILTARLNEKVDQYNYMRKKLAKDRETEVDMGKRRSGAGQKKPNDAEKENRNPAEDENEADQNGGDDQNGAGKDAQAA